MMFDARNNVQCNQSVQFLIFFHAIRMLVFTLFFLCKPSLLGTALAFSRMFHHLRCPRRQVSCSSWYVGQLLLQDLSRSLGSPDSSPDSQCSVHCWYIDEPIDSLTSNTALIENFHKVNIVESILLF